MTRPLSYPLLILCIDIAKTVDYSSEYFGLEPLVLGSEILKSVHIPDFKILKITHTHTHTHTHTQ
jgi:hypothetical protein